MSTIPEKKENGIEIEKIEFDFGEEKQSPMNSKGDIRVKLGKNSFMRNAAKAGIDKKTIEKVFKYAGAYNKAVVNHAISIAPKLFKDNEKCKRVIVAGDYAMKGTGAATVQKTKTISVGGLGSGQTTETPYVTYKVKDSSLPNKDFMKEKVASLIKTIK